MFYYILIWGKITLLAISSLGYCDFLYSRLQVSLYFLPSLVVASQIMLLFFLGMLNCLQAGVWILFFGGLFLGAYQKLFLREHLKKYMTFPFLFYAIALVCIAFLVKEQLLLHYDNFSHWGLIVKQMLLTDRLPTFKDPIIVFQSYPPGSACYIYFFCRIISRNEDVQMLAQGVMLISFFLPLFSFDCDKNVFTKIFLVTTFYFVLTFNNLIYDLLVDTLLPLAGMTCILFVHYIFEKQSRRANILCAVPYLCTVLLIKNAGIYFAVIASGLALYMAHDASERRDSLMMALISFLILYFWFCHCDYVFVSAAGSKHALSLTRYGRVLAGKTVSEVWEITKKFFSFMISGKELYLSLSLLLIIGVCAFLAGKEEFCEYQKVALLVAGIYFSYMFFLYLMYIFSMPTGEAMNLAGIVRYRRSILIAIFYLLAAEMCKLYNLLPSRLIRCGSAVALGILFYVAVSVIRVTSPLIRWTFVGATERNMTQGGREWLEEAARRYSLPRDKRYFLCSDERSRSYMYYMARYQLYSPHVLSRNITMAEQLEEVRTCDYLLVWDLYNPFVKEWLAKNYPDQASLRVVRLK